MTPMRARFWFLLLFLCALTALRWVLAANYELSPDEAYYTLWAQHPELSYYSKGPGIALTILASTSLWGTTEFGVRFFSPLLGLGTSLLVYFLARRLYRESVAFWATLALNLVPIFNVGSMVMTIDPLSIFFWAAALVTFWLALESAPQFSFWWPATGALIGCGFLAKYTNAFQLFSILFFLAVVPKLRGEFRRPSFYSLLLGFLPFLLPPLIWNQQHEWITLEHLSQRGGLDHPFGVHPAEAAKFLGAHFGVYSPLLFVGFLSALFGSIGRAFQSTRVCFLLSFAWPLLATYFVLSFNRAGEPNWTAPAFVSLGVLATVQWLGWARRWRFARGLCLAALVVGGLTTLITLNTDLVRWLGYPWPYAADPGSRLRGWKSLTEAVETFRQRFEGTLGEKVFLIGNKYQTSSMLAFYLKDKRLEGPRHPPVYIPESQDIENQFSFWPRYDEFVDAPAPPPGNQADALFTEQAGINPFVNRSALYITDRPVNEPPQAIQGAFSRCELVAMFSLERRRLPLRELRVFACYQYQTLPL
ncbi:MAG: glycosyltransferase family 39 protein [Verrucomicrobia bacterium]|nr:glycosyltransferase family 39 protein [Verrucomicrobiota bacterium]